MILSELFNKKEETLIGSIRCLEKDLGNKVMSIAQNFGMKNPNKAISTSTKGIKIRKVGRGTYLVGLMMFEPPKYILWTAPKPLVDFNEYLINISEKGEIFSYINIVELNSSTTQYFQLGIAKQLNS